MGLGAIFFDVGGVLVDSDLERYAERASRVFGAEVANLRREVGLRVRQLEKGELSSHAFWTQVGEALAARGEGRQVRPNRYFKLWRNLMKDKVEVNRDLYALCQNLARQGLVVGVLSNVIEDHAEILEERGIYLPFSPTLLSCRSGLRKPEPEFYRRAIARVGVAAGNCLLVDDNTDNLPPARAAGMRTHHYKDLEGLKSALRRHGIRVDPDPSDPWLVDERDFPWDGERQEQLLFLLRYAVLAPSSHNRQPWRFRLGPDWVEIEDDPERALPVADPRNRELMMSCGAALHHLRVALSHFGLTHTEEAGDPGLRRLTVLSGPSPEYARPELRAIPYQRSEWVAFEELVIEPALLARLRKACHGRPGVTVHWLEEPAHKQRLADLILQAARGQWRDRMFRTELAGWLKPGPGRKEGLAAASLGLGRVGYPIFWRLLPHYDIGSNLAVREAAKTSQAPVLAVISTRRDISARWFDAGAVLAELVLKARTLGLAALPVHYPLESDPFRQGMEDLTDGGHPQVVLRLGYGPNVAPAPRRGPGEVLVY